jgi:hypothetical protein
MSTNGNGTLYGLTAEFDNPESLMDAAVEARAAGYQKLRAHTPFHVEGLADVLEDRINFLPYLVPAAIFFGFFVGYIIQAWTSTEVYALNVGGRPELSIPAFIPVIFELGILTAGLVAVGFMFAQNGLPLPYHPIFNAENIDTASHSHFFLVIEATDRQFDPQSTKAFLEGLEPINVSEVQS